MRRRQRIFALVLFREKTRERMSTTRKNALIQFVIQLKDSLNVSSVVYFGTSSVFHKGDKFAWNIKEDVTKMIMVMM